MSILAFALRHPAMLEETRQVAQARYADLCATQLPEVVVAAAEAAVTLTFPDVVTAVLDLLGRES